MKSDPRNLLLNACVDLEHQLQARGETVTLSDQTMNDEQLAEHFKALVARLHPERKAEAIAPAAAVTAPKPTPPPTPAMQLTADELAQLSWKQKVKLAQGFLDPVKIRAELQQKALTPTQRVLKQRGVKTLAELRTLNSTKGNPHVQD